MSDTIKNTTIVAIEEESEFGTYVAPSAATSFVEALQDGFEVNPSKEVLERSVFNSSLFKNASRTGMKSVSVALPLEFKAGVSNAAPVYGKLFEGALGDVDTIAAEITTGSDNTTSLLKVADTSGLNVGDIILVKESGAYHVSPIASIVANTSVTLLVAAASAFSNAVKIAKCVNYKVAESGHKSYSITKYVESAIEEQAHGCMVAGFSIENFAVGQIPNVKFNLEGVNFDRSVTAPSYTPSYDSSDAPIALSCGLYIDGSSVSIPEISFSLENTLAKKTSINNANGVDSVRVSACSITGSFAPYKQNDSVANYTKWLADTEFSLFGYAYNPTATAGEFQEVVAFYFPKCQLNSIGESDSDGLLQDSLEFKVNASSIGECVIMTA